MSSSKTLSARMNEMSEKITTIADGAQDSLENVRQNAGSDWSHWSLLDDSHFQGRKERVEQLERSCTVRSLNRTARPRGQVGSGSPIGSRFWRL